jgi:hypothetical protein
VFDSVAVSALFTAVFAVTGIYALLRWASLRVAATGRTGDQVAELAHLLMSLAMIAMAWGYSTPASNVAQLVLFGAMGTYFVVRMATDRQPASTCACPAPGYHLLMCGAMVWMVVAMPWLMTGMASSDDQGSMQMDGMSMPMPAHTSDGHGPAPSLTIPVTVLIALALIGAAGYWTRRLLRVRPFSPPESTTPAPTTPAPTTPAPAVPAPGAGGAATLTVRVEVSPVAGRLLALLTPGADALCHLLMSLAMGAMLLLML